MYIYIFHSVAAQVYNQITFEFGITVRMNWPGYHTAISVGIVSVTATVSYTPENVLKHNIQDSKLV